MKFLAPALIALTLAATPAAAFSVIVSFPNLTYPDTDVTPSTKGCSGDATLCAPQN